MSIKNDIHFGEDMHVMKRLLFSFSLLFLCLMMQIFVWAMAPTNDFQDNYELEKTEERLYSEYLNEISPRRGELSSGSMTINGVTMPVYMKIVGEPGKNGYPLYIALRGGGNNDEKAAMEQTEVMKSYYINAISSGIYVVPSGVCASWDEHYRPESFLFYDRIIEDAIAFHNADPNRVYVVGFSSGGDGVYSIAPRMPDRYAAVNMSAGYPHVLKLGNYYNLPICLQVGELDRAYDRNIMAARFDRRLSEYAEKYGGGYIHETFIHAGRDHNNWSDYNDDPQEIIRQSDIRTWILNRGRAETEYRNTNAIAWMDQYQRDPLPNMLVWETSINAELRGSQAYYWLDRNGQLDPGVIVANYESSGNSISVSTEDISFGTLKIYLSRKMLDVFRDVKVTVNGKTVNVQPVVSEQIMRKTLADRGDPNYIFSCEIDVIFNGDPENAIITPVSFSENTYDKKRIDRLLYWDEDGVFHVDPLLFSLDFDKLTDILTDIQYTMTGGTELELSQPEPWPYWGNNLSWTYWNPPDSPSVIFMFQNRQLSIIYSEEKGAIPSTLQYAVKAKFGEAEGAFVCGGLCRYYLENNQYDNADHVVQKYIYYQYDEF